MIRHFRSEVSFEGVLRETMLLFRGVCGRGCLSCWLPAEFIKSVSVDSDQELHSALLPRQVLEYDYALPQGLSPLQANATVGLPLRCITEGSAQWQVNAFGTDQLYDQLPVCFEFECLLDMEEGV